MNHFMMLPDFRSLYPSNRQFIVPAGMTMNLPTGDWDLIWVEGKLVLPRTGDISVSVREFIVTPDGELDGGTQADPVTGNVDIAIADGPLDLTNDPSQWGKAFLGFGKVTLHGNYRTPFVLLTQSVTAGEDVVMCSPPSDWQVGDEVAVCTTDHAAPLMYELRQITTITASGLGLSAPLTQDYPPGLNGDGSVFAKGHVANVTRNIVFRSANPNGVKGHFLCADRAAVDIRYIRSEDMGRTTLAPTGPTNQIGRYALHLHHLWGPVGGLPADATVDHAALSQVQYRMVGTVALRGEKWGTSIHATHYGLYRGNLNIGQSGAGLICEDGSETGNVLIGNLSCTGLGDGHPDRYDHEGTSGACYWFRGKHNHYYGNVAHGGTVGMGFYDANASDDNASARVMVKVPNFPGADMENAAEYYQEHLYLLPLLGWDNNEIIASKKFGLGLWSVQGTDNAPEFHNPKLWNNQDSSLFGDYSSGHFYNTEIRGSNYAIRGHNFNPERGQYQTRFIGLDIQGAGQAWYGDERPCLDVLFQDVFCQCVKGFLIDSYKFGFAKRKHVFRNASFAAMPGQPLHGVECYLNPLWTLNGYLSLIYNFIEVWFEDYQSPGNNFRLWFAEQVPDYIVTQQATGQVPNAANTDYITITFSPEPGTTNQHIWDTYGLTVLRELAPASTTTLPGLIGLVDGNVTPPPPQNPTATLTASPTTIDAGQSSTLTWTTANADTVTLNGASVNTSGTQSVSPAQTTTYTLTATGPGGTVTVSVTVTVMVNPPPDDCQTQLNAALAKIADYEQRFANIKAQIPAGI